MSEQNVTGRNGGASRVAGEPELSVYSPGERPSSTAHVADPHIRKTSCLEGNEIVPGALAVPLRTLFSSSLVPAYATISFAFGNPFRSIPPTTERFWIGTSEMATFAALNRPPGTPTSIRTSGSFCPVSQLEEPTNIGGEKRRTRLVAWYYDVLEAAASCEDGNAAGGVDGEPLGRRRL